MEPETATQKDQWRSARPSNDPTVPSAVPLHRAPPQANDEQVADRRNQRIADDKCTQAHIRVLAVALGKLAQGLWVMFQRHSETHRWCIGSGFGDMLPIMLRKGRTGQGSGIVCG